MINKSNNLTQLIGYTLNNNNTILKNNINKENLKEYNYSKWLNWNENSCRYDSFFFIYCNALLPVLNSKINDPIISKINIIANKILNLKEYKKELGFWEIINKYNLDIIEYLNPIIIQDYLIL